MKTTIVLCSLMMATGAFASLYTNDIIQSGAFIGNVNTDHWNFGGDWRDNGADNVVFDAKTNGLNNSWHVNTGSAAALNSFSNVTSDSDYDALTTRLIGFNMDGSQNGSRWFKNGNVAVGKAGNNLNLTYFAEIDVVTVAGTYRYQSQEFDPMTMGTGWQNIGGGSWAGGSFLGDLSAGEGVALNDIQDIQYKMVMFQEGANTDGTGTVFILADAVSLNAVVETIPEPSTLGLVALFGTGIFSIRRLMM